MKQILPPITNDTNDTNDKLNLYNDILQKYKQNRQLTSCADLSENGKQKIYALFDKKIKHIEQKIKGLQPI